MSCLFSESARRELNPRPASYKDAALTVELRASESRVGGNRTHTVQIKSLLCCLLHHDPMIGLVYAFQSLHERHRCSPSCFAFSGSPGNRTQHDSVISRVWATSPRLPFQVGHLGVEPRSSCSQSRRAPICTCTRLFCNSFSQNGRIRTCDLVAPDHAR